jgi:Tfp pilus assembly protein PilF
VSVAVSVGVLLLAGVLAAAPGGPCAGVEPAVRSAAQALDRGQWAEAERLLQPLAGSHADCSGIVLGLARLQAARGDAAEAERLFARATTLASDDAVAHALFAQNWLTRGQPARADYEAALALSLKPDCPEALVARGRLLISRGRPQEARQALEEAVRLDPENAEAHYRLGILAFRGKRHDVAAAHFEKVVARRPMDALAHDYLALSFEALGEAERAERTWRRALEVNERPFFDPLLDYNYGRFLLRQGRLEESQSHLDRAAKLVPIAAARTTSGPSSRSRRRSTRPRAKPPSARSPCPIPVASSSTCRSTTCSPPSARASDRPISRASTRSWPGRRRSPTRPWTGRRGPDRVPAEKSLVREREVRARRRRAYEASTRHTRHPTLDGGRRRVRTSPKPIQAQTGDGRCRELLSPALVSSRRTPPPARHSSEFSSEVSPG